MKQIALRIGNRLKDLCYIPGMARAHLEGVRGKVSCFLYHRVVDVAGDPFKFLTWGGVPAISPQELASDIGFLREHNATFYTFEDLQERGFPREDEFGVIVCFDDCFRDNYEAGRAVLEAYGVRGVFFQTSGLLDRCDLLWEHALYWCGRDRVSRERLRQLGQEVLAVEYATLIRGTTDPVSFLRDHVPFDQAEAVLQSAQAAGCKSEFNLPGKLYPRRLDVRRAQQAGHEIGSHGHGHLMRKNITSRMFEDDLACSRDALADVLGKAPHSYSYPFSSHINGDESVCSRFFNVAAVVERNARIAKDTNPYCMPRFTWPGPARNRLRQRRWLLSGTI